MNYTPIKDILGIYIKGSLSQSERRERTSILPGSPKRRGHDRGALAQVSVMSRKEQSMRYRSHAVTNETSADPYSGSSLVPMLVAGLVLTLIGMIVAVLLT